MLPLLLSKTGHNVQIKFEQISEHLKKNFIKFYLVTGDEEWQKQNAVCQICNTAKEYNYSLEKTIHIENDNTWTELATSSTNNSFFSEKKLFRINLLKNKISSHGQKVLEQISTNKNNDNVIVLTAKKLNASEKKLAWIKKFDKYGAIITIWPIYPNQMENWVRNRAKHVGLNLTPDALLLLVSYTQNNLAAADQALLKIKLCQDKSTLSSDDVKSIIFQQAQYNCYDILDPLAFSKADEVLKIINILKNDESQINLLLFIILQELEESQDTSFHNKTYLGRQKIKRLEMYNRKFIKSEIIKLIASARTIEKAIKGNHLSNPWHLFTNFCLNIIKKNVLEVDTLNE